MNAFREQMNKDFQSIFNAEFAESKLINGVSVQVIIDNEKLKEFRKKEYDGIYSCDLLFSVRAAELKKPKIDEVMFFNGKQYTVIECTGQDIYEIVLSSNRS